MPGTLRFFPGAGLLAVLLLPGAAHAAVDLLPDMITVENDLRDAHADWNTELGCVYLRFSNATANVGQGPAEIFGTLPPNPDGSQNVFQRIYRDDATSWERLAGTFIFHPTHHHFHFEGWALYSLREMLAGGGVGPVVFSGEKTSFCLLDSTRYDRELPGFPPMAVYGDCADFQGISVGWKDLYAWQLPGQELRLCGLPSGSYWLESEVDPENRLIEVDENNNVARIPVEIPPPPACNDGIDNDSDGAADYPLDPGCQFLKRSSESPPCNDRVDNDFDRRIDYPLDPGCSAPWDGTEGNGACGLGAELVLLAPLLLRLRRRAAR